MKIKNNFKCAECGCKDLVIVFQDQTSKFKYNPKKFKYKEIKFKWRGIKSQCSNCKKIYYIKE